MMKMYNLDAIKIIIEKNVDLYFLRNNIMGDNGSDEGDCERYNKELIDNTMHYCYENCQPLTVEEYKCIKDLILNYKPYVEVPELTKEQLEEFIQKIDEFKKSPLAYVISSFITNLNALEEKNNMKK